MNLVLFLDYRKVWEYNFGQTQTLSSLNTRITSQEKKRREIQAEYDHLMMLMQNMQVELNRVLYCSLMCVNVMSQLPLRKWNLMRSNNKRMITVSSETRCYT